LSVPSLFLNPESVSSDFGNFDCPLICTSESHDAETLKNALHGTCFDEAINTASHF